MKKATIILSVMSLLNVLFVPIFDVWGGLFPSSPEYSFFDVVEMIFEDSDAWSYWPVILTVSIFIPVVLMLIASTMQNRTFILISSGLGMFLWLKNTGSYMKQIGDLEDVFMNLFDFDDGNICIGWYVAIALFVAVFIVAIKNKNSQAVGTKSVNITQKNTYPSEPPKIGTSNNINQVEIEIGNFCPNCGKEINKAVQFCGNCGYKF